jgi:hypothetical protein
MKKKVYVMAPHQDDELIGVFTLISEKFVDVVLTMVPLDDRRMCEIEESARRLKFELRSFVLEQELVQQLNRIRNEPNSVIFTPDPRYEYQPYHRKISGLVDGMCHDWQIYYYTVEMNTPYINETLFPMKKRELLDEIYPSQKELWKYNHKYFLFEGYSKKILILSDFEEMFFCE